MKATPGWYQDVEQPPGHLRYWDGHRWTEHRMFEAPVPLAASPARSWVARHKAWTAVLVVVLAFGGWLLPDDDQVATIGSGGRNDAPAADDVAARGQQAEVRGPAAAATPKRRTTPMFLVSRVIDGDTVELGNGETVRLVGIDTPEVGECGFEAASAQLARLVLGKNVRLARSDEDRDSYGRLLRYVDVAGTDAGLRLIENGRAIAAYDSRDGYGFHPREPEYVAGDRGATNLCPMATGTDPTPESAAPAPAPKPQPLVGRAAGGGCSTGYDPCLPAGPDLDCPDVNGPVRVSGSDPHRLDADGDGWACES